MKRRGFNKTILSTAALIATLGANAWGQEAKEKRGSKRPPNFVVILADDQGYGDLGCYGAADFKTPNIDRMAAEGMRFTSFYAPAPWCSPSRASLLTGRYPHHHGALAGYWAKDTTGLDRKEITIAEVLKRQGYATACIGKWHLGHADGYRPRQRGFDSWFGLPWSNDRYSPLHRDDQIVEERPALETLTRRYTEEAVKFIADHRREPFFLYLPHTMPHERLAASDRFRGKSGAGLYADVIMELDWSVGEILAALRQQGLDRSTLVVYTSDNGPALKDPQRNGSAGPLRGRKGTVYEGGMRVPGIMWWPDKIPAGRVTDEVASSMDLLPTFTWLAGGQIPRDREIDGHDLWPLLSGQSQTMLYETFIYYQQRAIRIGPWKYHAATGELFNLEKDVGEKNNQAEQHPEIVTRLRRLLPEVKNRSRK